MTLHIDPAHINCQNVTWLCDGCNNEGKPWITALIDNE